MSTPDDDSRPDPGTITSNAWWDRDAGNLRGERKAEQVRLMVEAFGRANVPVGIYPDNSRPADMEFMYRTDQLLTREEDADRVIDVLGGEDAGVRSLRRRDDDPENHDLAGLHIIELLKEQELIATIRRVERELGTGVVSPNHVVHITPAGCCPATDPLPSAGQPVPAISTNEEADGAGVLITVIDTGVLSGVVGAHPWLAGVAGDPEPGSVGHYRGHGTFVAGVARTMAPKCVVTVEALLVIGGGILESDLATQLNRALSQTTPDILSMSAGTTTWLNLPLLSLEVFWEERLSKLKGSVLVCAAGNDGDRGPFYPAASPWTVSVGALDADGARAGYSDFGSWVDVYARGSDVVNAYPTGTFTYAEPPFAGQTATFLTGLANWSGTSFSTPLVSGLIAARMSWSGQSAEEAADTLLEMALENATPRVGKVLEPGMGDRPLS